MLSLARDRRAHGFRGNFFIIRKCAATPRGARFLVSAVYLRGDERANLPYENDCGPF